MIPSREERLRIFQEVEMATRAIEKLVSKPSVSWKQVDELFERGALLALPRNAGSRNAMVKIIQKAPPELAAKYIKAARSQDDFDYVNALVLAIESERSFLINPITENAPSITSICLADNRRSPVASAAERGDLKALEALEKLQAPFFLTAQQRDFLSAQGAFSFCKNLETAKFLRQAGADPNEHAHSEMAWGVVVDVFHSSYVEAEENEEKEKTALLGFLLNSGARMDAPYSSDAHCPLDYCLENLGEFEKDELASFLIEGQPGQAEFIRRLFLFKPHNPSASKPCETPFKACACLLAGVSIDFSQENNQKAITEWALRSYKPEQLDPVLMFLRKNGMELEKLPYPPSPEKSLWSFILHACEKENGARQIIEGTIACGIEISYEDIAPQCPASYRESLKNNVSVWARNESCRLNAQTLPAIPGKFRRF